MHTKTNESNMVKRQSLEKTQSQEQQKILIEIPTKNEGFPMHEDSHGFDEPFDAPKNPIQMEMKTDEPVSPASNLNDIIQGAGSEDIPYKTQRFLQTR